MKFLIRHAKSDWSQGLEDHLRPLNARGRANAALMGEHLRAQGLTPQEVLCSDALRTRETCALLGFDAPVTYRKDLYHAGPGLILSLLSDGVAIIGHNPGLAEAIHQVTPTPPNHPRFDQVPTCSVAIFDGAGLHRFVTPHDL